ncbi:HAD family hydrolase [Butyrivibrio sp. AE2032]|uniref:HAD family hydrolase n=1 Tax=Butyrivibrio sp. AE2032 TaxID=1458463 RepID=UPI00068FA2F0|nr:HAD family hydrolase [Butyrivibrio sp. AE2032]
MKGIVFDIDDTLYCRQDMLVQAAEKVLGVKVGDWREFIRIFYEKSDINMAALESGEITTREINGWRYNETFRLMGLPYDDGDGVLAADAYLELQSHMFISEDMKKALDAFAADKETVLAILTAGESKHQRNKVTMLGLNKWFSDENVIVTGEAGFPKPDVRLFRLMEERLGLSPDELWMIGDNYDKDITGAINSGWHSLWINRRGLPSPEKMPDIEVLTDEELIKALKGLLDL